MGFKGARSSLRVEHYINIDDLRTFALFQIDWISYTPENAHVHTAGEGYWSAVIITLPKRSLQFRLMDTEIIHNATMREGVDQRDRRCISY